MFSAQPTSFIAASTWAMRWPSPITPMRLEAGIDGLHQGAVARVLPARAHVVGDIAEGDVGIGIAKAGRAARAKMPKGIWIGAERAFRLSQLKAQSETRGVLRDLI